MMLSKKILGFLMVFSLTTFFGCCCKKQEKTIQKSPKQHTSKIEKQRQMSSMEADTEMEDLYTWAKTEEEKDFDAADFAFLDDLSDEELVELDSALDEDDLLVWDDFDDEDAQFAQESQTDSVNA